MNGVVRVSTFKGITLAKFTISDNNLPKVLTGEKVHFTIKSVAEPEKIIAKLMRLAKKESSKIGITVENLEKLK
jgi:uncharacterized lipoprotein YajG